MNGSVPHLPLSTKEIFEARFTSHVAIGCLAVFTWDILHSLAGDFHLVFRRQFNVKTAVFFASRMATFGWILCSCIQITATLDDCRPLLTAICTCFALARSLTAMLFYFRVLAVYRGEHYVAGFFTLTWLAVAAAAILTFAGGAQDRVLLDPHNCNSPMEQKYLISSATAELVNDTFVLVAILKKLSADLDDHPSGRRGWRGFFVFQRRSIRRLTESFIQDSQLCYLVAVCLNLGTIITYLVCRNPPTSPIRIMMIYPNTTVVNIMATKVYRNMRLGRLGLLPMERSTFKIGNLSFLKELECATRVSDSTTQDSTPPSSPLDPPLVVARVTDLEAGYNVKEKDSVGTFDSSDTQVLYKSG